MSSVSDIKLIRTDFFFFFFFLKYKNSVTEYFIEKFNPEMRYNNAYMKYLQGSNSLN